MDFNGFQWNFIGIYWFEWILNGLSLELPMDLLYALCTLHSSLARSLSSLVFVLGSFSSLHSSLPLFSSFFSASLHFTVVQQCPTVISGLVGSQWIFNGCSMGLQDPKWVSGAGFGLLSHHPPLLVLPKLTGGAPT